MEVFGGVADVWRDFGTYEAPDGCLHDWALRVAEDPEVLAWLDTLPTDRERQPNLVLAAARWIRAQVRSTSPFLLSSITPALPQLRLDHLG